MASLSMIVAAAVPSNRTYSSGRYICNDQRNSTVGGRKFLNHVAICITSFIVEIH